MEMGHHGRVGNPSDLNGGSKAWSPEAKLEWCIMTALSTTDKRCRCLLVTSNAFVEHAASPNGSQAAFGMEWFFASPSRQWTGGFGFSGIQAYVIPTSIYKKALGRGFPQQYCL